MSGRRASDYITKPVDADKLGWHAANLDPARKSTVMQMSHEYRQPVYCRRRPSGKLDGYGARLESLEQPVLRARTGAKALKMLLAYDFAVILLDVQLAGFSGFEGRGDDQEARKVPPHSDQSLSHAIKHRLDTQTWIFRRAPWTTFQSRSTLISEVEGVGVY